MPFVAGVKRRNRSRAKRKAKWGEIYSFICPPNILFFYTLRYELRDQETGVGVSLRPRDSSLSLAMLSRVLADSLRFSSSKCFII